jgi:hypothetical protein
MFRHITTRVAGAVIVVAGLWGGLVPFVGPYFHFALGPNQSWTWTSGRFYLSVLPAIAAVIGGAMLIASGPRVSGKLGAMIALAAGVWFAVGPDVSLLWHSGGAQGVAHGAKVTRMFELVAYHTGLGVLIASFAAYALPGVTVVRPVEADEAAEPAAADTAPRRRRFAPFGRRRRAAAADTAPAGQAEPETAATTADSQATREQVPAGR